MIRRLRTRCRWNPRGQSGLTIVETMFAIVLMAIAFLGMAGVQAVSSKAQSLGKNHGLATYVANQQLEQMRRSTFAQVVASSSTQTVEGTTFTVARTVSGAGSNKRVEVKVDWNDRFGARSVVYATVISEVTNP